ncbi:MAG: hypothetical protein EBS89_07055 [Proteobacteria bacterium]|nr:hypothetical protein [Pseudomonadota bacterium]
MAPDQPRADELATVSHDAEHIIDLFRRVGRALRASDFDAPGEWAASLTMPQLRVLYLLGRQGSLPVGSVAEAMRISQPRCPHRTHGCRTHPD